MSGNHLSIPGPTDPGSEVQNNAFLSPSLYAVNYTKLHALKKGPNINGSLASFYGGLCSMREIKAILDQWLKNLGYFNIMSVSSFKQCVIKQEICCRLLFMIYSKASILIFTL